MDNGELEQRIRNIEAALVRIDAHLSGINGSVGDLRVWRAATEQVIDATIERVDSNCDELEKARSAHTAIREWMARHDGGMSARGQMVAQIIAVVASLGSLIGVLSAAARIAQHMH